MRMLSSLSVPEIAEMNPRPTRGGSSMRGGDVASHPPRELQYDRVLVWLCSVSPSVVDQVRAKGHGIDRADRFRSGKFESDDSLTRRRESSLPVCSPLTELVSLLTDFCSPLRGNPSTLTRVCHKGAVSRSALMYAILFKVSKCTVTDILQGLSLRVHICRTLAVG